MSDYEVLMVFYEVTDDLNGVFGLYISMVGAFLFVGLFFGQVLNRLTTGIVVFLYCSMMSGVLQRMVGATAMFEDVYLEMERRALQPVTDIGWITANAPAYLIRYFSETTAATLIIAVAASLIFFFKTRDLDPRDFR